MSTALQQLTTSLAQRLNMGDGSGLVQTLKATAFKGDVSDAQMTALMVVANQYGLNPWTKEIYAFPDRNNGIVPVVGVDGWSRIINDHPQFDGVEFEQDADSCTCVIFRKDRSHPIKVTEWMSECKRDGVGPWKSHPKRMLRHKAMIQCARIAFGYGGIYDHDEAERIVETIDAATTVVSSAKKETERPALPDYKDEDFEKNFPEWQKHIDSGKKTGAELFAMLSTRATFSETQKARILSMKKANVEEAKQVQTGDPFIDELEAAEREE